MYHCVMFRSSISAPQRSQRPSTTYSFAITVWSFGTPVDWPLLAVAEVVRDELLEEPLRPAVEGRLVRRDLPLPVDRPAEALHLGAHRLDVALDRLARMTALADRRVLGRQPERVPAHGPHDVPAAAAAHVGLDVAHRVVEDVAHVEARARRVRQHLELVPVVLGRRRARNRVRDVEGPRVLPDALPLRLDLVGLVSRCQNVLWNEKTSPRRGRGETTRHRRVWLP